MNEETFTDVTHLEVVQVTDDVEQASETDMLNAALSLANSERQRLGNELERIIDISNERQAMIVSQDERIVEIREQGIRLMDERDTARACQREAERELENFKQRVRDRMIEEADQRGWCSEFDGILVEFGLPPRRRTWDITFTITGEVTRQVLARDEERARALAFEELPISTNETYRVNYTDVYVRDIECDVDPSDD